MVHLNHHMDSDQMLQQMQDLFNQLCDQIREEDKDKELKKVNVSLGNFIESFGILKQDIEILDAQSKAYLSKYGSNDDKAKEFIIGINDLNLSYVQGMNLLVKTNKLL